MKDKIIQIINKNGAIYGLGESGAIYKEEFESIEIKDGYSSYYPDHRWVHHLDSPTIEEK